MLNGHWPHGKYVDVKLGHQRKVHKHSVLIVSSILSNAVLPEPDYRFHHYQNSFTNGNQPNQYDIVRILTSL